MKTARLALSAAVLTLAACGGDDPTAPTPARNANVAGSWSYTLENLRNGPMECDFTGAVLTLAQADSVITGTLDTSEASMECSVDDLIHTPDFAGGPVRGVVRGNQVVIEQQEMADIEVYYRGIDGFLQNGAMVGTVTVRQWESATSSTRVFTGQFRAVRK
jgi:hypothetical protein